MNRPLRTRIKICGVRDAATARAAIDAGADALGFVFHRPSTRFIEPTEAWTIASKLPPLVTSVGLTVDKDVLELQQIAQICPLDFAQLHGDETVEMARQSGSRLIKAIRYDPVMIEAKLKMWSEVAEVEAILIDGSAGGMGQAFDWSEFAARCSGCDTPIILAGGLTPTNVAQAVRQVRPFAVDVSSGVERKRGVKDPGLIEAFCQAVRQADRG